MANTHLRYTKLIYFTWKTMGDANIQVSMKWLMTETVHRLLAHQVETFNEQFYINLDISTPLFST